MSYLQDILDVPEWQERAQCRGVSQDVFFNETLLGRRGGRKAELESIAKSICRVCVVQFECLEYAIETNQIDGIWGGHTPKERKRIVRRQAQGAS